MCWGGGHNPDTQINVGDFISRRRKKNTTELQLRKHVLFALCVCVLCPYVDVQPLRVPVTLIPF